MVDYREFKIEQVLKWQPQIEIDPLKLKDLSVDDEHRYPFYGQSTTENGIIGYYHLDSSALNNKNSLPTILIHSNNQNVVYLETPFYLKDGHGATSVLQSERLSVKSALYIMTAIRKAIAIRFTYNAKATKIALKNTKIVLPVNEKGEIDYDYMENQIFSLEQDGLREMAIYLKANGLDDSNLTQKEQSAIHSLFTKSVPTKMFKVGSLFKISPTKNYGLTNQSLFKTKGNTPVVVNSCQNNGIGGYVDLEPLEKGNMITYSDTTTSEGIFYQPYDYIGYSHIQGFYPLQNEKWTKKSYLYFKTAFAVSVKGKYSYGDKFNRTKAAEEQVCLPITEKGEIDYTFMETYIEAIEKLILKDVIDWKDKAFMKSTDEEIF